MDMEDLPILLEVHIPLRVLAIYRMAGMYFLCNLFKRRNFRKPLRHVLSRRGET